MANKTILDPIDTLFFADEGDLDWRPGYLDDDRVRHLIEIDVPAPPDEEQVSDSQTARILRKIERRIPRGPTPRTQPPKGTLPKKGPPSGPKTPSAKKVPSSAGPTASGSVAREKTIAGPEKVPTRVYRIGTQGLLLRWDAVHDPHDVYVLRRDGTRIRLESNIYGGKVQLTAVSPLERFEVVPSPVGRNAPAPGDEITTAGSGSSDAFVPVEIVDREEEATEDEVTADEEGSKRAGEIGADLETTATDEESASGDEDEEDEEQQSPDQRSEPGQQHGMSTRTRRAGENPAPTQSMKEHLSELAKLEEMLLQHRPDELYEEIRAYQNLKRDTLKFKVLEKMSAELESKGPDCITSDWRWHQRNAAFETYFPGIVPKER